MKEVLDKKLAELIERYVEKCIFYYTNEDLDIEISRKAKQAIIDYDNKKVQEATKELKEAWEYYNKVFKYDIARNFTPLALEAIDRLKQAIEKTVQGVESNGIEEKDIMDNKTPNFHYKPNQKEMTKLAVEAIKKGKKCKYKLTYDKTKKTIIGVESENQKSEGGE